jgi:uncharacterized protein (TIGR03435 family)
MTSAKTPPRTGVDAAKRDALQSVWNSSRFTLGVPRVILLLIVEAIAILHPEPARAQLPAQATQSLAFEVASVKPSKDPCCSSSWNSTPGGRISMKNQSLKNLIKIAYKVKDDQISGGPKWIDSDRYDIDAKAETAAKDPQIMLMLQSLLAERFHLSFHRGTKQVAGFALVVAKTGLKIKPVTPSNRNQLNVKGTRMTAQAASLDRLCSMLTNLLKEPVVNETHVSEVFDFQLDWTPEAAPTGDTPTNVASDPAGGFSLISALQDQLGLALQARKLPSDILFIDGAEKPSEN